MVYLVNGLILQYDTLALDGIFWFNVQADAGLELSLSL
jgi:hypothetical protein